MLAEEKRRNDPAENDLARQNSLPQRSSVAFSSELEIGSKSGVEEDIPLEEVLEPEYFDCTSSHEPDDAVDSYGPKFDRTAMIMEIAEESSAQGDDDGFNDFLKMLGRDNL